MNTKDSNFEVALLGEVITAIEGATEGSDRVVIRTKSGREFIMYHDQDCCESVRIDQIDGCLDDVIGTSIETLKEEITNENPPGITKEYQDSFTWTRFVINNKFTILWYGESNGYYSESVSFVETS